MLSVKEYLFQRKCQHFRGMLQPHFASYWKDRWKNYQVPEQGPSWLVVGDGKCLGEEEEMPAGAGSLVEEYGFPGPTPANNG